MKRKDFFKTVAVGSAAALVGFPLFKAKSETTSKLSENIYLSDIIWSNDEPYSPYVDSDLTIIQNNTAVIYEELPNSGVFHLEQPSYIQVMQTAKYQWPSDSYGILIVSQIYKPSNTTTVLYLHRTDTWVDGVSDSFGFYPDAYYNYKIECYTRSLSST